MCRDLPNGKALQASQSVLSQSLRPRIRPQNELFSLSLVPPEKHFTLPRWCGSCFRLAQEEPGKVSRQTRRYISPSCFFCTVRALFLHDQIKFFCHKLQRASQGALRGNSESTQNVLLDGWMDRWTTCPSLSCTKKNPLCSFQLTRYIRTNDEEEIIKHHFEVFWNERVNHTNTHAPTYTHVCSLIPFLPPRQRPKLKDLS